MTLMDDTHMQKLNISVSFELLEFQESWNLIGQDQNWACLEVLDQNQAKKLYQFVGTKNV